MKLLSFSDVHIDAVTAGKPRKAEVVAFLAKARQIADEHRVDLVVFSGDFHDSGALLDPLYSAELIDAFLQFHQELIIIPGNHDVLDTSELYHGQPVSTLTPLRAAVTFVQAHRHPVRVYERPFAARLLSAGHGSTRSPGWAVLALPYLSRAHRSRHDVWLDEAFELARKFVEANIKLIVVGHLVVPGAAMGSESQEMAKGQDQLFPFERVAALQPKLVINGHYHARQRVLTSGVEINIPGSPLRFTFGEADQVEKGVMLVELDP